MKSAGFKEAYYILLNRTEKRVIVLQWEGRASHMVGTLENERCHREHLLPRWPLTKQPEPLGWDVRKVFSADLEWDTSSRVWSRRMGVRGAKQIPPTGRSLGLAWHGPDSQPLWRDGREQEQGPSAPVRAWVSRLGLMWKMGQKLPTEQRVSSSRW